MYKVLRQTLIAVIIYCCSLYMLDSNVDRAFYTTCIIMLLLQIITYLGEVVDKKINDMEEKYTDRK
jgi:hypothetical protein